MATNDNYGCFLRIFGNFGFFPSGNHRPSKYSRKMGPDQGDGKDAEKVLFQIQFSQTQFAQKHPWTTLKYFTL